MTNQNELGGKLTPLHRGSQSHISDLGSQLEDLMVQVMDCERWARFDDRLDLATRTDPELQKELEARRRRRRQGDGGTPPRRRT
jgi:hypothetical protein